LIKKKKEKKICFFFLYKKKNDIDSKNQRVKREKKIIAHTRVREQHSTTVLDLFYLVLVRLFVLFVDMKLGHQIRA
jgi:hypothetical protein